MTDLFDWTPGCEPAAPAPREQPEELAAPTAAPCRLIAFPLAARIGKIRKAARTLEARVTDEGKSAFWNRTVRDLRAELGRRGCDPQEADRQVSAFHEAVSLELARLAHRAGREQA